MTFTAQLVQVTSDTSSLLNALSKTFTTPLTIVGELLQNGRRAGATRIDVTTDKNFLSVCDNGVGVTDFSKLFAMAESGWDSEIKIAESPYGLGFISTLFACETLEVRSKGHRLCEATATLRALRGMTTEPVPDDGCTHVVLHGTQFILGHLHVALENLAKGFPIPITLNGKELPRLYALQGEGIDIGIGTLIDRYPECTPQACARIATYLQGLPIRTGVEHGGDMHRYVVHLDPRQVFGRLPDRESVIDPDRVGRAIKEGISHWAMNWFRAKHAEMGDEAFVTVHLDSLMSWGCEEAYVIASTIPLVPGSWFSTFDPLPYDNGDESCMKDYDKALVSREELEANPPLLVRIPSAGESFALAMFAHASGRLLTEGSHREHWFSDLWVDLEEEQDLLDAGEDIVRIETPAVIGRSQVEVFGYSVDVRMVPSITLIHRTLGSATLAAHEGVYDGSCLWVTPHTQSYGCLVKQVDSFMDGDDHYDGEAADEAETNLALVIKMMSGESPIEMVREFVRRGIPFSPPDALDGQRFVLTFSKVDNRCEWTLDPAN